MKRPPQLKRIWVVIDMLVFCIILLLFLILPVGVEAEYDQGNLTVLLKVWALKFRIFPLPAWMSRRSEKKREKAKAKPASEKEEEPEKEKKQGVIKFDMELLQMGLDAARNFKNKLKIDVLIIRVVAAAQDPFNAVMMFGGISAAFGNLVPMLENNFNCKERELLVTLDLNLQAPVIYFKVALTIRIYQIFALGLSFGVKFFKYYRKLRNRKSERNGHNNGK